LKKQIELYGCPKTRYS